MSDGMRDRNGPDEAALLRQARELMPPVDAEPRPGFAARVALRAAEQNAKPVAWWRFAVAGGAVTAAAAALVLALGSKAPASANTGHPVSVASNDAHSLLREPGVDLALARQLDLYEDLALAQNEDALEELDVVAQLHTLRAEAKP